MRGKETGGKETGSKETEGKETGGNETGVKETGGKDTGAKTPGAQYSQETGGKDDTLMCEKEMDNMLSGDTTLGQNATEVIRRKSYYEIAIEGVTRRGCVCG